jgi:hypothetical protein
MALNQSDQIRSNPSHPRLKQRNRKNRYVCCYYFFVIHDKDTLPREDQTLIEGSQIQTGFTLPLNSLPQNQTLPKVLLCLESTPSCH